MAEEFRNRELAMGTDWESCDRYEEMRQDWQRMACTKEAAVAIVKLVRLHYKGGKQKFVKLHTPICGAYNANWRVEFEAGSALLHVPIPGASAFFDDKVRAEVATMKMIEARTTIPVPHIYHWGGAADNPTGLGPFIIMDYIEHERTAADLLKPVDDPSWDIDMYGMGPDVSEETLLQVYRQMANILLQLSTLDMPCIGSPSFDESSQGIEVRGRPITQNMTEMIVSGGNPQSVLPIETKTFATSEEYYSALSDMHLAQLAFQYNGAVYSLDDCRDKYVARQLFRRLSKYGAFCEPDEANQPFILWCDDFRPSSVLLNEQNKVVGVIDWEFAYFAPASFSYDPPWWTILGKIDSWDKGIDDFSAVFDKHVPLFLKAMELEEAQLEQEGKGPPADVGASALSSYLDELDLDDEAPKLLPKLSQQMKKNWKTGRHYINYAARNSWTFDPLFWKYIDQRFFGQNIRGGFEERLHLLSDSEQQKLKDFAIRKVDQLLNDKLKVWDEQESKEYLEELFKDC